MDSNLKVTILTASCCNPALKPMDEQYTKRVKQALGTVNTHAEIEVVTATEAYYGKKIGDMSKLRPLFDRYGMDALPALFVNEELALYGGLPSIDKLVEVLQKAIKPKEV
ncbi:MAG: thioredoxin family protein [Candidatus Bathyarchaeota archaeon]|nr:thioredoxin family protein [Candidatus Bathyarchaeota archaeon]